MRYVLTGTINRLTFALALIISAGAAGGPASLRTHAAANAGLAPTSGHSYQPAPPAVAQGKVNGRIAFVSGRDRKGLSIYTMNEDGSGVALLTGPVVFPDKPWMQTYYGDPAWSPDGKQLAFYSNRHGSSFDIYVMNADGGNVRRLTDNPADEFTPAWSPDGTKIAFGRGYCATVAVDPPSPQCEENIYVMNADGSDQRRLTDGPDYDIDPAWSPDGSKIAFTRGVGDQSNIYVVNPDGSGLTNITASMDGAGPAWSPDGTKIAFASAGKPHCCGLPPHTEIYTMNPDGSNPVRLTTGPEYTNLDPSVKTRITEYTNINPAWSPDGTKITFQRSSIVYGMFPATGIEDEDLADVFVMNADGSNQRLLTPDTPEDEGFAAESPDLTPDWQPLLSAQTTVQFSALRFTLSESGQGDEPIVITRLGDLSQETTVNFTTSPCPDAFMCAGNFASERSDYMTTSGTLHFASGEASKNIHIPFIDDVFVEGDESFFIVLSNPVGGTLGANGLATVIIADNDTSPGAPNPVDQVSFFVRQHYLDFLGREPEPQGLTDWQRILSDCPASSIACDHIEVSSAFFRSPEFYDRGYFIYRFYSAVGKVPRFEEFMPDMKRVSGFQTNQQLEASKVSFINDFITRADFTNKYGSLTDPSAYVSALEQTLGVTLSNRAALISGLQAGTETRATVLRKAAEDPQVGMRFYTEAFVIMQYFGYLRRSADASYLQWIQTMNQNTSNYRIMINGFLNSIEYRQRFGP